MSQDGIYYQDTNGGLIKVTAANPLPTTGGGGGGTVSSNITQVGGEDISLGQTTSAGSLPVTIASDQTLVISGSVTASGTLTLGAGAATIGNVAGTGTAGSAATGVLTVQGIASMTKLLVTPDAGATVQLIPGTTGGLSLTRNLIANNTTNLVIKGSAGQLYGIWASNNSATIAYIKIYNATSATAGSGTPVDTIMIPAPAAGGGGGLVWSMPNGVAYGTGITIIVTTGIADADTSAPAASTYVVTMYYK